MVKADYSDVAEIQSRHHDRRTSRRLDRHINASLNLLRTAVSAGLEAAGGLRFGPGASQHDVMMVLCGPERGARPEPNATSC